MPLWQVETAAKLQLLLKNRRKRSRTQAKIETHTENRKSRKKSVFPVFLLTFLMLGDMVNYTSNEPYKQ